MTDNAKLPFGLAWGMQGKQVKDCLIKADFEYDAEVNTYFGSFNWPGSPKAIADGDVVASYGEGTAEEPLELFALMVFPDEDLYSNNSDAYAAINADQQDIFNYFIGLYGQPASEGEELAKVAAESSSIYKAWQTENFFLTIAMDKVEQGMAIDEGGYMVSLTFSRYDDLEAD
ncbi:MAG: hypothetical protein FWE37_05570 [Spirochaetaceae bacterium]|nr:hypothetical protein [Spirochaetaceae bacterium]